MLAVVQIGSRTLRSECITALMVLGCAHAGMTKQAAATAAARTRNFMDSTLPGFGGAIAGRDLFCGRRLDVLHVLIALGGEPQRVVAHLDRRILRRVVDRL